MQIPRSAAEARRKTSSSTLYLITGRFEDGYRLMSRRTQDRNLSGELISDYKDNNLVITIKNALAHRKSTRLITVG